jgi:hypothetical protein
MEKLVGDYVFISHSSADKKLVDKIVIQIEKRGIKCWISSRDIRPGRDYQQEIVSNLEQAKVFLLLFSQNASQSQEILKELSLGSKFKKPLIPARIEDIIPSGAFMYQLSNAQIFDLFDDMDKKIQELCDDLLKYLDANADLSQIRNLETRKTPKPSRLHGAYAFGALAVLGVGGWAYLQFQKHQHNVIEPSQIALPSASTVTASITQHQGPPPIAPLAKDATSAPKKSLGLTVPSLSVAPVLPPVSATGAEPVTAPKPEIICLHANR